MRCFSFHIPAGLVNHVRVLNTLNKIKAHTTTFTHTNQRTETGYTYEIHTDNTAAAFKIGLTVAQLLPPGHKLKIH